MKTKNRKADASQGFSAVPNNWKYLVRNNITKVILAFLIIFSAFAYKVSKLPDNVSVVEAVLQRLDNFLPITDYLGTPLAIRYRIEAMFVPKDTIRINMKHINVQKVEYMRLNALQNEKDFDYVPATIQYGKGTVKVKMRLKGDRKIHFEDMDTASYRIRVKGDYTLLGMKSFSIHKPRSRNYLYEWFYLRLMSDVGLMSPQYRFVHVVFNGKDLGPYAIEEHYDKYLIERHQKREGPIVRFREFDGDDFFHDKSSGNYQLTAIAPYVAKKWHKQENLPVTQKAVYLLEGYRRGELSVGQVFDVDKLAMFFAMTDLSGTHHGSVPKSLRFYYNPITSRLEPIPFDGHFGTIPQPTLSSEIGISPNSWIYLYWREWFISLFNDPDRLDVAFIRAYVAALEKVSSPKYLDDFFLKVADDAKLATLTMYGEMPLKDKIYSFGPELFKFDKNDYYKRQEYIRDKFSQVRLTANLVSQNDQQIEVDVSRYDRQLPLEVVSLSCGEIVLEPNSKSRLLVSTQPVGEAETHRISFSNTINKLETLEVDNCNKINFRILGHNELRSAEVYPWSSYDHDFVKMDIARAASNYSEFDFIATDPAKQELHISSGIHEITKNLIIPKGYTLVVGSGTTLVLNKNALIFSRSALKIIGTKENPVKITSRDGTGQGVVVIGANKSSYLEEVEFNNLNSPAQQGWSIPGSVTFYESPVKMVSVSIHNSHSEDAVNIVRTHFDFQDLRIVDAYSDALDVDFGKGVIRQSLFVNAGNDAIDVSGTELELQGVEIMSAGDKGVSAGEGSRIVGHDLKLQKNRLGVVSKDNSIVRIEGLDVSNSKVAIAAYQKKPEYGPGSIYVDNFVYDKQGAKKMIESGSLCVLDGHEFVGDQKNVEKLLLAIP